MTFQEAVKSGKKFRHPEDPGSWYLPNKAWFSGTVTWLLSTQWEVLLCEGHNAVMVNYSSTVACVQCSYIHDYPALTAGAVKNKAIVDEEDAEDLGHDDFEAQSGELNKTIKRFVEAEARETEQAIVEVFAYGSSATKVPYSPDEPKTDCEKCKPYWTSCRCPKELD